MKCDDDKTYTESPSMVSYSQEGGVIMDCQPRDGQLQVHIVEGAGLIDENTHKPFNTIVKWYADCIVLYHLYTIVI